MKRIKDIIKYKLIITNLFLQKMVLKFIINPFYEFLSIVLLKINKYIILSYERFMDNYGNIISNVSLILGILLQLTVDLAQNFYQFKDNRRIYLYFLILFSSRSLIALFVFIRSRKFHPLIKYVSSTWLFYSISCFIIYLTSMGKTVPSWALTLTFLLIYLLFNLLRYVISWITSKKIITFY